MSTPFTLVLFVLVFAIEACGQTYSNRLALGRKHAEDELKKANTGHNVIDREEIIIKDDETAIKIAELILFDMYGKKNITKQRPYETYLIDQHWVIQGTLPKGYVGGTFLIIIDATNSHILKITHGR